MGKLAENCPAATLTWPEVWTLGLLVVSVTKSPPVGAGAVSLTVPVALVPPIMAFAGTVTDETQDAACGFTVTVTDTRPQVPVEAEMLACVAVETLLVFTLKFAEVCPAGTITCPTTCTSGLLLCKFTTR